MSSRKRKVVAEDVVYDLSGLIEYRKIRAVQDGKGKKPDVLLIEIRQAPTRMTIRNHHRSGTTPSPVQKAQVCVLKRFPATKQSELSYNRELNANTELMRARSMIATSTEEACRLAFEMLKSSQEDQTWARCLGTMRVSGGPIPEGDDWAGTTRDESNRCHGILFEYFSDLDPLTPDMVNEDLAESVLKVLRELHSIGILHRDHVEHTAWPQVGFRNLFVRRSIENTEKSAQVQVVLLDFGCAVVLGNSARDRASLENEMERMQVLLNRARSKKLVVDHLSREVKKLLG